MSRQARVTVAYATVKLLDPATGKWTVHGFPQGAVFPSNADPDNVANLVRREYAEWVETTPDEAARIVAAEDAIKADRAAREKAAASAAAKAAKA